MGCNANCLPNIGHLRGLTGCLASLRSTTCEPRVFGRMTQTTRSSARLASKLHEHFGFKSFRPGQEAAVRATLAGRDTLVLMPTGSGKSLCFQLPGLEMEGSTIVVSPLISLMKDQSDALERNGRDVVAINSTLSAQDRRLFGTQNARKAYRYFPLSEPETDLSAGESCNDCRAPGFH